jgi:DNA-binding CsgD family transcriptional regulator
LEKYLFARILLNQWGCVMVNGALTSFERYVVRLVANGISDSVIARRLNVSTEMVGTWVSGLCTKLKVKSRTELLPALHASSKGKSSVPSTMGKLQHIGILPPLNSKPNLH